MTTESSFSTRLAVLLGSDILLTVVNAYTPHELGPIRALIATVQLVFMIATMVIAIREVLEDF